MTACSSLVLLGAYYYTWYGIGEQWQVFPRPHEPILGEYRSADDAVIRQHHAWAKAACIDFLAVSWGGDGTRAPTDKRTPAGRCELADSKGVHNRPVCHKIHEGKEVEIPLVRGEEYAIEGWKGAMQWWSPSGDVDLLVQRHLNFPDALPMALMYEVRDVLGVGEGRVDLSFGDNPKILEHHLLYAAERYFKHPNYMRIGGRPVLFLYTMRDFDNFKQPLAHALRQVETLIGERLYVIGDMIWWSPGPDSFPWQEWKDIDISAVTAYNLFDSGNKDTMGAGFSWHSANLYASIAARANAHDMLVVPYVSPGYDDRKMRGRSRPAVDRASGAQYVYSWQQMLWFLRCQTLAQGKEEEVEPSDEFGSSYISWTRRLKSLVFKDRETERAGGGTGERGAEAEDLELDRLSFWDSLQCDVGEGGWKGHADLEAQRDAQGNLFWEEASLLVHEHWRLQSLREDSPERRATSESARNSTAEASVTGVTAGMATRVLAICLWAGIAAGFCSGVRRGRPLEEIAGLGVVAIIGSYFLLTFLAFSSMSHDSLLRAGASISGTSISGTSISGGLPDTEPPFAPPRQDLQKELKELLRKEFLGIFSASIRAAALLIDQMCTQVDLGAGRREELGRTLLAPPYPPGAQEALRKWCPTSKFDEFVRRMYVLLLGRPADEAGVLAYVSRLVRGSMTTHALQLELLHSPEGQRAIAKSEQAQAYLKRSALREGP